MEQQFELNPQYVATVESHLRNVSNMLRKRGREILSNFDITPPQFNALLELKHHERMTMGDLCEHLYLASSTVTDLVDRMENNGFVERVRDPRDRRVITLKVTDRGYTIVDEVMEARRRYLKSVLERVLPGDRDDLLRSLEHLLEIMTEARV